MTTTTTVAPKQGVITEPIVQPEIRSIDRTMGWIKKQNKAPLLEIVKDHRKAIDDLKEERQFLLSLAGVLFISLVLF
tara:strand:+ start:261 stop:491 length:231 start_codon:yes stop_codon:yes gene_type:complete